LPENSRESHKKKRRVDRVNKETVMSKPIVGWFEMTAKDGPEIPNCGLTSAFIADPEGHVVGLSTGAVQ